MVEIWRPEDLGKLQTGGKYTSDIKKKEGILWDKIQARSITPQKRGMLCYIN